MSAVLETPVHPAVLLLSTLGGNGLQVAASLAARGITGNRDSLTHCPIAHLLADEGIGHVEVSDQKILLYVLGGQPETIATPQPIADFIARFDAGQFPQLIANRRRRTGGESL